MNRRVNSNPNDDAFSEPRPVFVDADIRVFEGQAATERLRERNDLKYLTNQGIVQVDRSRWHEAQRYERKTWMSNLVNADDDRNHDHKNNFGSYQAIAGREFRRVIELGCGPFTNLRLILPHIRAEHVTLLDPLIKDYLNHPHCTYRSGSLLGVPVETVASSIEEFNPSEPYDLLVMANVLEHCFDVPAIFQRILQSLKPGGVFVFGDNAFRPEQLQVLLASQFDAGHPIRVTEPLITNFLKEGFTELYQQRFFGRYDQPHRIDIYFVGIRHPVITCDGTSRLDLSALLSIEDDVIAQKVFCRAREHFGWSGQIVIETAAAALKAGRVDLAEKLSIQAATLLPESAEAAALRQRITNFRNTFFVTVGQILTDSKMGRSLTDVIGRFRPQVIVDLGAASGLGSTTVLAEAVARHGLPAHIYAVESAPQTFERLKANVARFSCVTPLHGSVVNASELPAWEQVLADVRSRPNRVLEHITVEELKHWYDHTKAETENLWRNQGGILKKIPAEILDLVVIDADLFFAREALAAVIDRTNILVLDDVTEHKNAATHEFLTAHPDWEILDMDLSDRHGWSIFRRRQFLQQPLANQSPRPRIHFVYSGDPRNDAARRAPATITNRIFRFLEQRADVIFYDLTDTTTVPDVRPDDIVLGHPHPNPNTIMHRLLKADCAGKHLIFPFHSRLPEINRFVKELAQDARKLFLISGPYWTTNIERTEFASWKNKIVRLDNSIDLDFFALRKKTFNGEGRRGMLVLGRSGPEKGTTELFKQLCNVPGRLLIAGEFMESDLAILKDRPDTENLGVLDWRNEAIVQRVIASCDFFVNFSVSDASPTTLFETMALGLIPVTTPQCGYTYPSFISLSLTDAEHNLTTLQNLQALSDEELITLQRRNRSLVEQNHNWPRFLAALWKGLTGESIETAAASPSSPRRVKVAADYADKLDLTQIGQNSEFATAIRQLFREHRPTKIVETGTYFGEGTTRVIAKTLRELGLNEAKFHSIEINPDHLARARQNLSRDGLDSLVQLHHGISVPRSLLPSLEEIERRTVREIEDNDIFVDHREHERATLYFKETDFHGIPDDVLGRVLREFKGQPDFVLLDSGGHMGNIEFNYLLSQLTGPCWIALDDVHHIKHRRSLRQMQQDSRFQIVVNSQEKFGFCIARFTPAAIEADNSVERLLWVRLDSIGDAALASSMLPWLKQKYPRAEIAVLCQQHVAELYLATPMVSSIICLERQRANEDVYRKEILAEIAAFNPQLILNSTRSRDNFSNDLTLAFNSARHIAIEGDLNNISEADRAAADSKYETIIASPNPKMTELARHAEFLRGIGIQAANLQPVVWTNPDAEELADAFFQNEGLNPDRTIALFPGAQFDIRVYPGYVEALQEFTDFRFLIFGDSSQAKLADALVSELGSRALNLAGKATLLETAALLRRCRLYVGAESAGAHIACAVNVPNVVILGGGHFGRFMPYSPLTSAVALPLACFGCNWRCSHSRAHCIKDVSPNVLAEAIRQTLAKSATKPRLFIQAAADWAEGRNLPAWQRPNKHFHGSDVEIIEVASAHESQELTPAAEQHVAQAQAALDRGDTAAAVAALESARKLCPHNADVLVAIGNLQFQLGNAAASFDALQAGAKLRRSDPLVHVLLAAAAEKCKRMPDFEKAVSRALELDRAFAPAHRLLADLNLEAGRFADAAREYGFLFKQNPNDIPVMLALGKCLAELRQFEAAEECFAHVLKLDRHNQVAAQNLNVLRSRPRHPSAYQSAAAATDPRLETIGCPFCKSRNAQQVRKSADIVRCSDCNTVYLRTRAKKEVMERLYQTYADDGSHMALPKTFEDADRSGLKRDYFLKEILTFTKPEGKLLDVGCGWGAFLLNGRQHGFEVSGLEITRKAAGYGNQALQIPIKTTQFLETEYAPDSHSVITMLHVFEHLPYPKQALDKVFQVLKPGGMFCGIVPNFNSFCSHALGEQWYWLDPNYHYVHYTPATLRKHLEAAGFIVERIYTNTGDYGTDPIKKLLASQDAATTDPSVFGERLKQIETEGRGEEIRFFARKPAQAKVEEPVEIIGGEGITNPLVSVVVSAFNSEKLLRPCLENLTRQTIFPQTEVIVVDSGSEQNERHIALEFIQNHPNIRYVRTPRETIYGAWNRGLALARGRYWVNANTDDSLRDDALEVLVAALDKHADCALAYADTAWTTKPNDTFPSSNIVRTVKYPDYAPVETLFYCITGCLQFWRTEAIRQLGGFDASLRCAGDYEATLKMMAARMNAVHVPEVLSLFFQNAAGLTQSSKQGDIEHDQVMNRYRNSLDIAKIFQIEPGKPSSTATALAVLGAHAAKRSVPWEDKPVEHLDFAFDCFHRALDLDPENAAAGCNLVVLSHKLKRLEPDQAELIRRWPKMQEWIAVFKMGDGAHVPFVKHAVLGPVYRPSQEKNRPTAEQLAREPRALRPWISRIEGRHVYLSEELFPRPSGLNYTPAELQDAAKRLSALLRELPKFYAHFGGAGDALVLLASFYDKRPEAVVFSHPNSIPATKALFEAFPKLSKIYFLPQHTEPFFHIILRYAVYELNNCLGAGATPKFGYDEEWKASLDIEKKYRIKKAPRWAAAMRNNANSRRIAVAPKGSLTGMVGSKRNIILPELWPQVIAHIIQRGYEPVIFGVPSEAKDYPALPGCADARGESFAGQMKRIGECAGLVGADSWAKTFTALAEIPTVVFEPLKGADLIAWKDPSDWVFIEPWSVIKMVRTMDEFRSAFDSRIAKLVAEPIANAKPVVAWEGSFLDYGSLSNINREVTARMPNTLALTRVSSGAVSGNPPVPLQTFANALSAHTPQNTAVTVRHQWPPNWSKPATGKLVVIQPWEYGALPKAWVQNAANVDEFWVPSPLVRAMYVDSGIAPDKVRVISNGVDTKRFRPGIHALALPTKKKFKFLFVGGTIYRKGIDVLLEAFQETFRATDDVALVVKDFGGDSCYRGQTAQEVIREIQQKPGAPEIVYLTDELSPEQMPSLYAACDCLVLPYRGEGFGMPVLEAMSCGLPVIVTGGGATDFFVTNEAGWILPSHGLRLNDRVGDIQLVKNGWLRQPSKAHLAFAMEHAFKNPAECRRRGAKGRGIAERRFDWSDVVATMAHRLKELAEVHSPAVVAADANTSTQPEVRSNERASATLPACAQLGDLQKARGLFAEKKFADAWQATLSAIKARPFHPEGFLLLAETALAIGDAKTAQACAERVHDFAPAWSSVKQLLKKTRSAKHSPTDSGLAALMAKDISRFTLHASRLSVCLIAKNEEKFLGQCLNSIRNLAHQIVVVDTGSTDRTVEIAKEHGAEVHTFAWCDDFSAARNAALEHATGDWILMLDADEELLPDQHAHLLADLKKVGAIAHRLPLVNRGQEADGRCFVPRLFRNAPGVFFHGRIHEQVFPSLVALGKNWGLVTALGSAEIVHHGYSKELVKDRNKIERNLVLLRKAVEENPADANLVMNFGLELVRSGDLNGGVAKYREAFRLMSDQPTNEVVPELREVLLSQFTSQLYKVREHDEVIRVLTSPLARNGGLTATLHFALGLSCFELKNYREAVEQMRQCLAKRKQPVLSPINTDIHTPAPQHCIALSLAKLGDSAGAEKAFQAALAETGRTDEVRLDYAKFLTQQNRQLDALHKLHEIVAQNSSNAAAWRIGGEIALSNPEFFEFACDWTGEAAKNLASDTAIVAQRAEALMLSGNTSAARELWDRLVKSGANARATAALILCELIESRSSTTPDSALEPAISREFLLWYQKLIAVRANKLVAQINGQTEKLSRVLPRAGGVLEKALVEAGQRELAEAAC